MLTKPLLPYQDPAVDMFLRRGTLLCAMEQGLGKTVVGIACAEELLGAGKTERCLVVGPAALKYQWAEAVAEFTDVPAHKKKFQGELITIARPPYCVVIDGTPAQRAKQYASITDKTDYVIMGYDNIVDDPEARRIRPAFTILDEATAIKSPTADRTHEIKRLLNSKYRLALTGTPVENLLEEVFFIMQWVDKDVFGKAENFEKTYFHRDGDGGRVLAHKNLPLLHERLSTAMYRKTREDPDVAPYMPEVITDEIYVPMPAEVHAAYQSIGRELLDALRSTRGKGRFDMAAHYAGQDESTKVGRVMAMHQALEMLLDHPDLIVASAEEYEESDRQRKRNVEKSRWPGSRYCYDIWQDGIVDDILESLKLMHIEQRVRKILADEPDAKILIYTYWKDMLSLIEDTLKGIRCVQYHGDMSAKQKAGARASFTNDPKCHVFLSSHAGAYGCDMYMAKWLMNADLPWASGVADQINGRHVRASSKHEVVHVLNFVTQGTIEERKLEMLEHKRTVARASVDGKGADRQGRVKNDLQTLTAWLQSTV